MKDCECGKPVRLRAQKITVNRHRGVTHWIEHMDGSQVCRSGEWSCAMMKPYPKNEADKPWHQMRARWEAP